MEALDQRNAGAPAGAYDRRVTIPCPKVTVHDVRLPSAQDMRQSAEPCIPGDSHKCFEMAQADGLAVPDLVVDTFDSGIGRAFIPGCPSTGIVGLDNSDRMAGMLKLERQALDNLGDTS